MDKRQKKVILDKVEAAIDSADARYEGSRDHIVSAYEGARDSIKAKGDEAKEYAKKAHSDARDYVAANPEKTVLGAAVIGVVVGAALAVILGRRR